MKNDRHTQALIGALLALFVCKECLAQVITIVAAANSVSAHGIVAGTQINESEMSNLPDFTYSESISADDGSTAFATLIADFNGSTLFQAFGRVTFTPGQFFGSPSQGADGQGTSYLTFQINVPVHFQFTASCQSSGSAQASVIFDGSTYVNDTVASDGTFAAGKIVSIVASGNSTTGTSGGLGHWSYGLQLTPSNVPARFGPDQKTTFLHCHPVNRIIDC